MEQTRLILLIDSYLQERITVAELAELNRLMDDPAAQAIVEEHIQKQLKLEEFSFQPDLTGFTERLETRISEQPALRKINWLRYVAAAVVLFAIAGSYFLMQRKETAPSSLLAQSVRFKNDVAPGKTGAILSMEGGKTILLDTADNGSVLGHFTKDDKSISVKSNTVQYATLSTPEARTEMLRLSDGSMVWLNAGSSIRFPTIFTGNARSVEITGEVYFEIVHNEKRPFQVHVKGQLIEDLGTEFNVNAYDNERQIRTTLVSGAARVTNEGRSVLLKPGEQSQSNKAGNLELSDNFDMEQTLAWKNGLFKYNGENMHNIMKQVERWYGVDVVFQDEIDGEFVGKIPRDVPVSKLLNLLEGTKQVHFRIEGKTITVIK